MNLEKYQEVLGLAAQIDALEKRIRGLMENGSDFFTRELVEKNKSDLELRKNRLMSDLLFESLGEPIICYRGMTLQEIQYEILHRYRKQGKTYEEIGKMLSINKFTVAKKIAKGRKKEGK